MRIWVSLMLTILVPYQVLAAGSVTATVVSIRVDASGNGMVMFNQNVGGSPPGCVISYYQNALAFNSNEAGGKAIYAMALTAKATGGTLTVQGKGTCTVFGSYVEDWDYGVVN